MHALLEDVRVGVRTLTKKPAFTLRAVLTLAVGIGSNTAIFSLVNAVLLRQLPFAQPERLVQVHSLYGNGDRHPFALPNFCDYRDQSRTAALAAFANWSANLTG